MQRQREKRRCPRSRQRPHDCFDRAFDVAPEITSPRRRPLEPCLTSFRPNQQSRGDASSVMPACNDKDATWSQKSGTVALAALRNIPSDTGLHTAQQSEDRIFPGFARPHFARFIWERRLCRGSSAARSLLRQVRDQLDATRAAGEGRTGRRLRACRGGESLDQPGRVTAHRCRARDRVGQAHLNWPASAAAVPAICWPASGSLMSDVI